MKQDHVDATSASEPDGPSGPSMDAVQPAAGTGHTAQQGKPASKDHEVEQLKEALRQAQERHLRLLAECDNTKKRLSREKEEFARYASESLVRELLPIVDSLDQALVAVDRQSDPQAVIKGVHLIYRQLLGLLNKEGVVRIPTVGERFDPHLHEAVAHAPAAEGQPEDVIVEEVHVGYTMRGKVIRPAMVKVAKQASPQSTVDSPQEAQPGEG